MPTYLCCATKRSRSYVLENLRRAGGEGGQRVGRLRHARRPALDDGRARGVRASGSRPTRATTSRSRRCRCRACRRSSTTHFEGRHVDLRPYILYGKDIFVLPGRPDARRAEARARSSSTRRRAAAARTPGCSPTIRRRASGRSRRSDSAEPAERSPDAEPRRRLDLLDEPLRRARGERRALHRRQPQPHARPAGRLARSSGSRSSTPPATPRSSRSATATATQDNVIQFLTFDPENPNSIARACARRARTPARCARSSRRRCGSRSTVLPDGQRRGRRRRSPSDPHEFFASVKMAQPSVRGRHRRDDDAQRGAGTSAGSAACSSAPTRRRASST